MSSSKIIIYDNKAWISDIVRLIAIHKRKQNSSIYKRKWFL